MSVKKVSAAPSEESESPEERAAASRRMDRVAGWLIVALALALYLRTGARDLLPGDPGEFQFAAWRFGVAHATGYPLYLIGGGLWQRLLGIGGMSPAYALNVLSAFTAAAAVGVLYMGALRVLPGLPAIRRSAALLGAAWLATMPTFWSQALIAEVYALHALFLALLIWVVAGWEQSGREAPPPPIRLLPLALLVGLSLTHHATTLLLLPGLAAVLWQQRARLPRSARAWVGAAVAMAAPLLLYLYIPLRATPQASPWLFPTLGGTQLALYGSGLSGLLDFVSGRSISVGFHGVRAAVEQLGTAWQLWRIHLGWPGIAMAAIGLYAMASEGRRSLLTFSVTSALLLQIFNLFYAIGDILVYYIPLYLFASLWIAFGAAQLAQGMLLLLQGQITGQGQDAQRSTGSADADKAPSAQQGLEALAVLLVLLLLFFPMRQWVSTQQRLDQTSADGARRLWESVLAAAPAEGAVLVSNDRDEVVPLYYLQAVEERRTDLTGIFPLLAPGAAFADIGATLQTALDAEPDGGVQLIKPMPGLEVRFTLWPAREPLVRVLGPAAQREPRIALDQPYGPLQLAGIDWDSDGAADGASLDLRLYWRVQQQVPGDFTTTVQLFDAAGNRLAQSDAPAGGLYYPTSLWKVDETLVERHSLTLPAGAEAATLLVGMYTGPEAAPLEPPLNLALEALLP
jgi:hypothetical protein